MAAPDRISRLVVWVLATFVGSASLFANEPATLTAARVQFTQLPNPTEADRQNYLIGLARMRDRLASSSDIEECLAPHLRGIGPQERVTSESGKARRKSPRNLAVTTPVG